MKHKILVVDDMADILVGFRHILADAYEVHTAESGAEALELCREEGPFAVVLTDQGMPGMNGTELLAHMRRGWPDTVRVMMTGYANLELAIEALHEGAIFRFIQKPFRPQEILDVVEAAMERFDRLHEERVLTEQLQFSRESLLALTESLEHRLASQIGRMRGLQRFALDLARTRSLDDVAQQTASSASRLLSSRPVEVVLEDPNDGLRAQTLRGGELPREVHEETIQSLEETIGTIRVAARTKEGIPLDESDREILSSLACVGAIAASQLIALRARDLANDTTLCALERLAEHRDDETSKHLERLRLYSGLLAREMRTQPRFQATIDDVYVRELCAAAPLHDIGKVGIPDSILLKPGPLTQAEWEVMRKHTTIGARTLRNVMENTSETSVLRMAHEIAWAHHERWDGTGYPRGLTGAEIPLAARIVAVADCYDALTTWRPFRSPWTHDETVAFLREQSGRQFDPAIVEAFEICAEDFDRIRERMADTPDEIEAKLAA